MLGQVTLTTNTIHNLQVLAICVRETEQPADESACLFGKTKHVECIYSKGGISQPDVAIIPVAHTTQFFWQRSGWSSNDSASRGVGQHFECQCAALYPINVWAMIIAACHPFTPAVQGMS